MKKRNNDFDHDYLNLDLDACGYAWIHDKEYFVNDMSVYVHMFESVHMGKYIRAFHNNGFYKNKKQKEKTI